MRFAAQPTGLRPIKHGRKVETIEITFAQNPQRPLDPTPDFFTEPDEGPDLDRPF